MTLQRLPLGIQTFKTLRTENYLYVDKTALAEQLINHYKFVFLSRPRRFGKSLFISTLDELLAGNKELFTGLAVENTHNWEQKHPVIRIDMSGNQSTQEESYQLIYQILLTNQERLQLTDCENDNLSVFFERLIQSAYKKYQQSVVVLVDEYDKPLLDNINRPELSETLRDFLQGFYVTLKKNDPYLRFVFLTGVSKFSKVSIFSGLNNLSDISLNSDYATICGYTQNDIETVLAEYLQGVDLAMLKDWYNGYQFNGEAVYNPYDILKFIDNNKIYSNYWFETATPTFLIKQLQQKQYYLPKLENLVLSENDLNASNINDLNIETLLLQTGYLTIKKVEQQMFGGVLYHLGLPNKEVQTSLSEYLIKFMTKTESSMVIERNNLYLALQNADMDNFQQTLTAIFASIPYHIYSNSPLAHYEGYYSVVMYSYLLSLGVDIELERSTNKGRLDMVVDIADKRYLIEFKMDGKGDALQQIKDKQYFQAFYNTDRQIYLMGIDFCEEEKNVSKFEWEKFCDN
ncbi:MAG: AAA family ATPase [Moraxellaceae bacterium]|nr:AAA family ATPase [Moraxellaceae bacterium]